MPTKPDTGQPGDAPDPMPPLETDIAALSRIGEAANLNDLVLGISPAMAAASLFVSNANSLSILYENAVSAQQQQTQLAHAAVAAGILQLQNISRSSEAPVQAADLDEAVAELLKAVKAAV